MAQSTCIKCGSNTFEMVEREPRKSAIKCNFVQCADCGGVVGVVDYYNTAQLLYKLAAGLKIDLDR